MLAPIFDDKSSRRRVTGPVAFAIDGKDETAWGIDVGPGPAQRSRARPSSWPSRRSGFDGGHLAPRLPEAEPRRLEQRRQPEQQPRADAPVGHDGAAAPSPIRCPPRVRAALAVPRDRRSPSQTQAVFSYWRTTVPEWKDANDADRRPLGGHPEGATQLVLDERGERAHDDASCSSAATSCKPAQRGRARACRRSCIPLPEGAPADAARPSRAGSSTAAPPRPRASIVNRVWQAYFGTGLVATPEDFGRQGERPVASRAARLARRRVHGRRLEPEDAAPARSSPPRPTGQSSKVTPALLAKDPYNRLLARGPRVRVDAEIVRDIALAASGLLNPKLGGPSVYPPAPALPLRAARQLRPEDLERGEGRRTATAGRSTPSATARCPIPVLQAFDAPNGDISCVRRARSNTPLQALTTLNEPALPGGGARPGRASALEARADATSDRVDYAFRRVLAREPTPPRSRRAAEAACAREQPRFANGRAQPLEPRGERPGPAGGAAEGRHAWSSSRPGPPSSRVLLNLDETITNQ